MLPKIVYYPIRLLVLLLEFICEKTGRTIIIYGRPNTDDRDRVYLVRNYLFPSHWKNNIYIHRFLRSDYDVPHDHPFDFTSLVLDGGYKEDIVNLASDGNYIHTEQYNPPGSVLKRSASHIHRVLVDRVFDYSERRKAPLTVIFRGQRYQDWGFWTEEGWIKFDEYLEIDANQVHKEAQ